MNTIDIKKSFIRFMEEKHSGLLFPKNFFGCMMAVFVEQEPITQDTIQKLTNYSKTTISQILKLLQVNFPLVQIKRPKKRKKYYTINLTTKEFMITFLRMLIEAYQDKADFLLPLIEEINPYTKKHPKFQQFKDFLINSYKYSSLYLRILTESAEEFGELLNTGDVGKETKENTNVIKSQEHIEYIQGLFEPPKLSNSDSIPQISDKYLSGIYVQLKENFYQKFRENLTSARSQNAIARTILGTELLLENHPLTQEELEMSTGFQRSIISDTLKTLINMKMVQVIRKQKDRKKYYTIVQSWDTRTINRLRLNIIYATEMKKGLNEFIELTRQLETTENVRSLLAFFQEIHNSYEQFEQYFKLLETKYLNIRLKEHITEKKRG